MSGSPFSDPLAPAALAVCPAASVPGSVPGGQSAGGLTEGSTPEKPGPSPWGFVSVPRGSDAGAPSALPFFAFFPTGGRSDGEILPCGSVWSCAVVEQAQMKKRTRRPQPHLNDGIGLILSRLPVRGGSPYGF